MERLGDDPQAVIINRLSARFLLCITCIFKE